MEERRRMGRTPRSQDQEEELRVSGETGVDRKRPGVTDPEQGTGLAMFIVPTPANLQTWAPD